MPDSLIDDHPGIAVLRMLLRWVRVQPYPALLDRRRKILAEGLLAGEHPRRFISSDAALQIPKRESAAYWNLVKELTKGPCPLSSRLRGRRCGAMSVPIEAFAHGYVHPF
jgi:hypothetical protein